MPRLPKWTGPQHQEHLIRFCEMLESPSAQERADAAIAATRLLRAAGTNWRALLSDPPAPARAPRQPRQPRAPRQGPAEAESELAWKTRAQRLLAVPGLCNEWERSFLGDVLRYRTLTEKQAGVVQKIEARLAKGGRARSA